ncbi:hypothetical protein AB0O20_11525 [Streptomyces kronopolitis]|uniref:hypothetical protein n=1 Tax=Streptomyces kronopolitis TaxID=1612435 RepID=UPI00341994F6
MARNDTDRPGGPDMRSDTTARTARRPTRNDAKAGAADKQSGSAPAAGAGKTASPVHAQRLADGVRTAEIHKLGERHHHAKIVARGEVLATPETMSHDVGLDANGIYIVLDSGGVISAHAHQPTRPRRWSHLRRCGSTLGAPEACPGGLRGGTRRRSRSVAGAAAAPVPR